MTKGTNNKTTQTLVDQYAETDKAIKEAKLKLAEIRKKLEAKIDLQATDEPIEIAGRLYTINVVPSTRWKTDPQELFDLLKKQRKLDRLPALITVKAAEARKLLGEDALESISQSSTVVKWVCK